MQRKRTTVREEPDELLTPDELSDWLQIPVGTLYQWRYRRRGPEGIIVGRHLRYPRQGVEHWLEQQGRT